MRTSASTSSPLSAARKFTLVLVSALSFVFCGVVGVSAQSQMTGNGLGRSSVETAADAAALKILQDNIRARGASRQINAGIDAGPLIDWNAEALKSTADNKALLNGISTMYGADIPRSAQAGCGCKDDLKCRAFCGIVGPDGAALSAGVAYGSTGYGDYGRFDPSLRQKSDGFLHSGVDFIPRVTPFNRELLTSAPTNLIPPAN